MKQAVKRKAYYVSVIIALIVILVCAVIINRTLVNAPEIDMESISAEAGEPVSAYMAYVDSNGDIVVGIAEENDAEVQEIIDFVKNIQFEGEYTEDEESEERIADAWVIFYDAENRIASRMNFYAEGTHVWYDGARYIIDPSNMQTLIEYCNRYAVDEEDEKTQEELTPEPTALPEPEEN